MNVTVFKLAVDLAINYQEIDQIILVDNKNLTRDLEKYIKTKSKKMHFKLSISHQRKETEKHKEYDKRYEKQ